MLTCNLAQSNQRKQNLAKYMAANVLVDNRFICTHFRDCQTSHPGIFYEGQLHHIGKYYDLAVDDKPFRIVVVGQAYGHAPARVTMEQRYQMIVVETGEKKAFGAGGGLPARNPHMRGTTSLLRLLFGIQLGTDHASEYIQLSNGEKCHIFDAFSLVNYLLCSAVPKGGSTTDKSTPTMRQNCRGHFRQTLEILEPTMVVVQGIGFWSLVRKSFDRVEPIDKVQPLYRSQLGRREFLTAAFSHPSARDSQYGWGANDHTPYLIETVVPTVKRIKEEILGRIG
jgi:uracil-DNA glycosylase